MKKWLSYLWPFTSRIKSPISGTLEVSWINGKKMLDSPNANYSYGSLQKVLEFGLARMDLSGVSKILLLGMGGGSVIQSLRNKFKYTGTIIAVELDEVVVNLAKSEFQISEGNGLKIHVVNAIEYLNSSMDQYDLIIVDLFVDTRVPSEFYQEKFWNRIVSHLNENGQILFNAGMNLDSQKPLEAIVAQLSPRMKCTVFNGIVGSNTLMIATTKA